MAGGAEQGQRRRTCRSLPTASGIVHPAFARRPMFGVLLRPFLAKPCRTSSIRQGSAPGKSSVFS